MELRHALLTLVIACHRLQTLRDSLTLHWGISSRASETMATDSRIHTKHNLNDATAAGSCLMPLTHTRIRSPTGSTWRTRVSVECRTDRKSTRLNSSHR